MMSDSHNVPITSTYYGKQLYNQPTNNKSINNEQDEIIREYETDMKQTFEQAGYKLPLVDICIAHISYISNNGLLDADNTTDKDKINIKNDHLDQIYNLCNIISTYRNIDQDFTANILDNKYSSNSDEPTFTEQFIANAMSNEPEIKINPININKNFVMIKIEKGQCEARYISDENQRCQNKTENGKICCSEHRPLTQEEKRMITENKSRSFSSNESETVQSELSNNGNNNSDKCKYIKGGSHGQCKNTAYVGGFCKKCHKTHSDESSILQSNNYCTVLLTSGINKDRVCGVKSCGKGIHMCSTHYSKINHQEKKKCPHINKNGTICNKNISNPLNTRCGFHINCVSSEPKPEPEKEKEKDEDQLEFERNKNAPPVICNTPCKSGKLCSSKASYPISITDEKTGISTKKLVCGMHANSIERAEDKPKTHRCEAICSSTGEQCRRCNVPICDSYCITHEAYEPVERCGAFDIKTFDRCTKNCAECEPFCKGHVNYDADPIKYDFEVAWIRGQFKLYELYDFNSKYTVVCVDPPKLKLKILSNDEFDRIQKQKILATKSVNEPTKLTGEAYGLDYFVSDSEDSDGTETEEEIKEIVQPEVKIPKPVINPDEYELVNKATGWTEEQIKLMKNKKIFKRVLGSKKKFDLEKTLYETTKKLEQYFTKVINDTNAKYKGCKDILSNLIRYTFYDLSSSVSNVIGLFSVQQFSGREKLLPDCKERIKVLRSLESIHNNKIKGLPIPNIKKQLVSMDIEKYIAAFEDAIHTVKKEIKEDVKYIKEFQNFRDNIPKKQKNKCTEVIAQEKETTRKEFNEKYINYFEKYIVRFAKVALHKENCRGRMYGFTNYFIDLLHEKTLDYTRFKNAYGGELVNEGEKKAFYCDIFTIVSEIINKNADKKDIMDYLDVDISINLSSSEHQTEFSEDLRECKRSGKAKFGVKSMLDEGKVERFDAKEGCYDGVEWKYDQEYIQTFIRNTPGYTGNYLLDKVRENNYPMTDYVPETTKAPRVARELKMGKFTFREEIPDDVKPSFSNNVEEILGIGY